MIGSLFALSGIGGLGLIDGPYAAIVFPLSQVGIVLNGLAWIGLGLSLFRPGRIRAGVPSSRAPQVPIE
jgi:hypothetical protein